MTGFLIGLLVGQGLFARTFGGTGYDESRSIAQARDGGYAIAGHTASFGAGAYDCLVLKLSSDGSLAWARTFGGPSHDGAESIVRTTDGGYAVAGKTWSFGAGLFDFLVFRLDQSGNLSWAKTFGGTDEDRAYSIVQTSDGGYAVAGFAYSFGAGECDFLVLRLDSAGTLKWARTFGGPNDDKPWSIIQTQDGGYAVVGFTYSFGAGWDFLVIRLDPSGNLTWARTFGGTDYDEACSITQTQDGGFAIAGRTYGFGAGDNDILVIKIDPSGNLIWARTFGGTGYDGGVCSITQTQDGGFAVAGHTASFGAGAYDCLVLKLSSDGSLVWARTFGGPYSESAGSAIQTSDTGYAMVGETWSLGAGNDDLFVLRLDQNGNYPGCAEECSPTVTTPSVTTTSPSVQVGTPSPVSSNPNLSVSTPGLTITDACPPSLVMEDGGRPRSGLICSPIPDAMLFVCSEDMPLRIYSADGRLILSKNLTKGENRINLEQGVYLWIAESYKGKAVVR
jgi:hypothetical protein